MTSRHGPSRNSDQEEAMKQIGFFSLGAIVALMFAMAFPVAATPKAPVPAAPAVAPVPAVAVAPVPEPHPEIHDALEAMHNAKHHLESAAHDFGGHRVKAIEHLDAAMHEAEICMSMDR